jgi:phospholipid/cholesterol/gamma-HCH transport system substrate-binding protein
MPRFREFNVLTTALVGIGITAGALIFAFLYPQMPWVAGHHYQAEFTDGGGMEVGDYVEVAGTDVGKVTDMVLNGDKVLVTFTAKGIRMGDQTTAAIKTGTLLGKRFLGLNPAGDREMKAGDTIPLARTTAPYNISKSIENVTQQIHDFDKPKLQAALNSFADAFQDTPANFKATFANVKALSDTISSRDVALRELLAHANNVSGVLNDRTEQFQRILIDGNSLLAQLRERHDLFVQLFHQFNYLTYEVPKFVWENDKDLYPVLDNLNRMLDVIRHNDQNLTVAIQRVSSFVGGLGEGLGSGPAFSAQAELELAGKVFNYTDLLRQVNNPQAPRLPSTPGLPGGFGHVPNPFPAPPSGANATKPIPVPRDNGAKGPSLPVLGGN